MKEYKVYSEQLMISYATIKANSEEEAEEIANNTKNDIKWVYYAEHDREILNDSTVVSNEQNTQLGYSTSKSSWEKDIKTAMEEDIRSSHLIEEFNTEEEIRVFIESYSSNFMERFWDNFGDWLEDFVHEFNDETNCFCRNKDV
jgi:hypothetical protein